MKTLVQKKKHKLTTWILAIAAVLCAVVLIYPFLPKLYFYLFRPKIDARVYENAAKTHDSASLPKSDVGNRLILPSIGVNAQIVDGPNVDVLGKTPGVWHEKGTENPTQDGNMVIAGHRFQYKLAASNYFYNLTEVKPGQKIYIKWADKIYAYEVFATKTIKPSEVNILLDDPNVARKLTLYTCTPLGSTAKRFVVEAKAL